EAVSVASQAGALLAASEGSDAAADYLADAASAVWASNFDTRAWTLVEQGLRYAGDRRDLTWALLADYDLQRRDANDPDFPGIPLDVPERHEVSRMLFANAPSWVERGVFFLPSVVFESREDAIDRARLIPQMLAYIAGEYTRALALANPLAAQCAARGQLGLAATILTVAASCASALGNLDASCEALVRATELAERIGNPPLLAFLLQAVPLEHAGIRGEGYGVFLPAIDQLLAAETQEIRWAMAAVWTAAALVCAHEGRCDDALRAFHRVLPAIERAPGWAATYTVMTYLAIEVLWVLDRIDHIDLLERNLREKTLKPDFRYPHTDARLALARLCGLTGRFEEARGWFDKARRVLDEQGARPLRAIVDFDEAWMEVRRGRAADRERALALLDAARGPFNSIGMPGWVRRADELRQQIAR
ncbi:MAG TPA: hypothetical protein DEP35_00155, partial [Deltaproteobacteria bacterium]|nr:hypothetical protein [Deltaproteobacteria bacterium]